MIEDDRRLWRAVIERALEDAKGRGPQPLSLRNAVKFEVAEWLASPDFARVCDMAGLDPEQTRARFPDLPRGYQTTRYAGLDPRVADEVKHTPLDRGEYLAALRSMSPSDALAHARAHLDAGSTLAEALADG